MKVMLLILNLEYFSIPHQTHLHRHWLGLITSAMPYMGRALSRTVLCVVLQLCRNLDLLTSDLKSDTPTMQRVPPGRYTFMYMYVYMYVIFLSTLPPKNVLVCKLKK